MKVILRQDVDTSGKDAYVIVAAVLLAASSSPRKLAVEVAPCAATLITGVNIDLAADI